MGVKFNPLSGQFDLVNPPPDLSAYVPYTGATANLDLGTHNFSLSGVLTQTANYFNFIQVTAPTAPSLALAGVAGLVPVGTHYYSVTYTTAVGDTVRSSSTTIVVASAANAQVTVTIPVSSDPKVTGRKIWRGGDGTNQRPVGTVANNTDVTFTDNMASTTNVESFVGGTTAGAFYQNGTKVLQLDTLGSMRLQGTQASLRIPAVGGGFSQLLLYNTADEKENVEFGGGRWNSNIFEFGTFARGGGLARKLRLKSSNVSVSLNLDMERAGTDWLSVIDSGTSIGGVSFVRYNPTNWTATAGENKILTLGTVGLNNTSGGGYSLFNIDATGGSGGSGSKLYQRFTLGGTTIHSINWLGTGYFAGNIGIGVTSQTARLHLAVGTAAASSAPLKITAGTLMTTPEIGAIESDGTHLYWTDSAGTRKQLD